MKKLAAIAALSSLVSSGIHAQEVSTGSLKYLSTVSVAVSNVEKDAEAAGLSVSQLTADIEQKLRRSRLGIVGKGKKSDGLIYVNVNAMKVNDYLWAYHVQLVLEQGVVLTRSGFPCVGRTWWTGTLGATRPQDFVTDVRTAVGQAVDSFIKDYRAENP